MKPVLQKSGGGKLHDAVKTQNALAILAVVEYVATLVLCWVMCADIDDALSLALV